MLALGNQILMNRADQQRDAVPADLIAEKGWGQGSFCPEGVKLLYDGTIALAVVKRGKCGAGSPKTAAVPQL
jgi:hypothetical protein